MDTPLVRPGAAGLALAMLRWAARRVFITKTEGGSCVSLPEQEEALKDLQGFWSWGEVHF